MMAEQHKTNLYRAGLTLAVILCVYFGVKALSEFRSYGMMGSSASNVITVSGHGEVTAVPDVANVYFTMRKEAKSVTVAQEEVAKIEAKALEVLKNNEVAEKDIKTTSASFNPKYEYVYVSRFQPSKQNLIGYEAYETIHVKVRKTDNVGKIMQELGAAGVTELNGPDFSVDDEDELKAEARKQAIEDAKEKAETLADDLDVRLVRIANFSESGYYPTPYYYAKDAMNGMGGVEMQASAPALPTGENMISSDVTITYEIR